MVLTRDVPLGSTDVGNATGLLPDESGYGLPDGDTSAGALDGYDANGAASPDATEFIDPYAAIPPDLLTQHEAEIAAREAQTWQSRIAELHQIKNREQRSINRQNVQLKAQLTARDQYIRQNAERWGLSEGDIAILTNQERTAADTAGARFDAVTQRGDEQFNWAQQRLTENLKSAFGDTWTAQVYDPQRDAQFKPLWDNALQLLGQWVMAGEPTDHRFVTTQRAFDDVRNYLTSRAQGGNVVQQQTPQGQRTPPPAADQRARQQQRGPVAPARTGGTGTGGQGIDERAAWDQARREHPDDPKMQFRRALRLQEGGAG